MMQTPPETMLPKEEQSTDPKSKSVEAASIEAKKEDPAPKRDEAPKAAVKEPERKATNAGNGGEPMDVTESNSQPKSKTPEAAESKAKTAEPPLNSKGDEKLKKSNAESAQKKPPTEEISASKSEKKDASKADADEPMEVQESDDKKDVKESEKKQVAAEPKEEKVVASATVPARTAATAVAAPAPAPAPAPAGRPGRKRKADIEQKEIEVETSTAQPRPKRTREVPQESPVEKRSGRKRAAKPEPSAKKAAVSDDDYDDEQEEEDDDDDDEDDEPKKKKRGRGRPPKADKVAVVRQPKHTGPTIEIPAVDGNTVALSAGDGEVGQLGIGEQGENGKSRFVAIGDIPGKVVRCAAGGMHSLLLTDKGEIYSFGCNDDGSLGRLTDNEEDCFVPKLTPLREPVAKLAAGNIHSVAITKNCKVYIWGSYRDNNGAFGIQPEGDAPLKQPTELKVPEAIVDVACGADHTLFLSNKGNIFSMGCGEQGRLGRLKSSHCSRENRRARQTLLTPVIVPIRKRKIKFDRVWAGRYNSFARTTDGSVWGCGLNNYSQLGEVDAKSMEDNFVFFMVELKSFDPKIKWEQISGGEQHTLALDADGSVYAMGRVVYGRLGLGKRDANDPDVTKPTLIPELEKKCSLIAAGDHTSFALDKDGQLWSWGQGTNLLGQGSRDDADTMDVFVPTVCASKALRDAKTVFVSAGSNHALCVVKSD